MKNWLKGGLGGLYGLIVGILVFFLIKMFDTSLGGNPAEKQQQDLILFIIIVIVSTIVGVIVGTLVKRKEKRKR